MKKLLILLAIFSTVLCSRAQYVEDEEDKEEQSDKNGKDDRGREKFSDRLVFGGNIQLQFGNYTILGASPMIGYRITPRLLGGVGGIYTYYRIRDRFGTYENSIYGGSVFGRFYITEEIFAHAEYNLINLQVVELDQFVRRNVDMLFVGGGYRMPIGENSYIAIMALFDVIQDRNSPYSNPTIRGGVLFGL